MQTSKLSWIGSIDGLIPVVPQKSRYDLIAELSIDQIMAGATGNLVESVADTVYQQNGRLRRP